MKNIDKVLDLFKEFEIPVQTIIEKQTDEVDKIVETQIDNNAIFDYEYDPWKFN